MNRLFAYAITFLIAGCGANTVNTKSDKTVDELVNEGYQAEFGTRVFNQSLSIPYPKGFFVAHEQTSGANYILEMIPKGESVYQWSQMITITGAKDVALKPNVTPLAFMNLFANGFQKECPKTFSLLNFGATKINGFDTQVTVMSCGRTTRSGKPRSESTLIIAIKGSEDLVSIQWAEQDEPKDTPIELSREKWVGVIKKLSPIKTSSYEDQK